MEETCICSVRLLYMWCVWACAFVCMCVMSCTIDMYEGAGAVLQVKHGVWQATLCFLAREGEEEEEIDSSSDKSKPGVALSMMPVSTSATTPPSELRSSRRRGSQDSRVRFLWDDV